jgi:ribosomal protein S18 acetylase RimI-like enzyme
MIESPKLARRIEEASLNAWPALQQLLIDGWVARFADGYTKRANSVTPLYAAHAGDAANIALCEQLYAARGLLPIFRLTSLGVHSALDDQLAQRGYQVLDPSRVLALALDTPAALPGATIALEQLPPDQWLAEHAALAGLKPASVSAHRAILSRLILNHNLVRLREGDQTLACGLAVCEPPLVGLFDIIVSPQQRRRGLGSMLVRALLDWGRERGAKHAYLQVVAANTPALALYQGLGFRELYSYQYRAPAAP